MSGVDRPEDRGPHTREDTDEGFLNRWSRRKAAVRRDEDPDAVALDPARGAETEEAQLASDGEPVDQMEAEAQQELSVAELAERCELPDPEGLGAEDDFKPYLKQGIPLKLRNAALRRLWRTSPDLACVDGLVEYGEDYATMGAGAIQTAYEVGSGFKKRIEHLEAEQARKAQEQREAAEAQAAATEDRGADGETQGAEAASEAQEEAREESPETASGAAEKPGDAAGADTTNEALETAQKGQQGVQGDVASTFAMRESAQPRSARAGRMRFRFDKTEI